MSLWVDKYRPQSLGKLNFHVALGDDLKSLAQNSDFPHLLFFGPPGAGKKTRIMCFLREVYGSGVDKLRIEQMNFTTASGKKLEVSAVASNYHIELNPSDAGVHDRVVVQDLIKTMANSEQLETNALKSFKVVILNEVDRLTRDAQHALRRTMEKYAATCRLILVCSSTTRVIPAIRSRCLALRISAPTIDEIADCLQATCKKEGLSMPRELATRIAAHSGRNVRRALLTAEACRVQQYPFTASQPIKEPDWITFIKETAAMITGEQSARRLLEVRGRLYELLAHCLPPSIVMTVFLLCSLYNLFNNIL